VSPNHENELIKELRDILVKLSFYKGLSDHLLNKEPPIGDPVDEIRAKANLRVFLLDKIGKYRDLITKLTGTDKTTIYEFGKPRTVDMWTMGLREDYDYRSTEALNDATVNLTMAISKLEREIDEGYRDEEGNIIEKPRKIFTEPPKAFIAHGGDSPALKKLKGFLEALGVQPLVVEEQPSKGRSIAENVDYYARQADCAIILATKGDIDARTGGFIPRGNVLMETGKLQEIFKDRIVYLLQAGTKFPTNISEKVRERFTSQNMDNAFIKIAKELTEFGILRAVKP